MLTLQFRQATGFQIISDRRRGYLVNGGCVRFLSAQSPDVEDGTSYKDLSGVRVNALTTTAKTCGRQAKSSVSRFSPNWPCLRSSWPLDCARLKRTWPHVRPQVQSPGTSRERDRERERACEDGLVQTMTKMKSVISCISSSRKPTSKVVRKGCSTMDTMCLVFASATFLPNFFRASGLGSTEGARTRNAKCGSNCR